MPIENIFVILKSGINTSIFDNKQNFFNILNQEFEPIFTTVLSQLKESVLKRHYTENDSGFE